MWRVGRYHPRYGVPAGSERTRKGGAQAKKELLPLQPGDVPDTYADVEDLVRDTGYRPDTPVEVGVSRFVEWYRTYFAASQ